MKKAFNPHWVNDESCRDYEIDNIIILDVPDSYVLRKTKFRGPYGFAEGNIEEFINDTNIEVIIK